MSSVDKNSGKLDCLTPYVFTWIQERRCEKVSIDLEPVPEIEDYLLFDREELRCLKLILFFIFSSESFHCWWWCWQRYHWKYSGNAFGRRGFQIMRKWDAKYFVINFLKSKTNLEYGVYDNLSKNQFFILCT